MVASKEYQACAPGSITYEMLKEDERRMRGVLAGWTRRNSGQVWYLSPPGYSCGFVTTLSEQRIDDYIRDRNKEAIRNILIWC